MAHTDGAAKEEPDSVPYDARKRRVVFPSWRVGVGGILVFLSIEMKTSEGSTDLFPNELGKDMVQEPTVHSLAPPSSSLRMRPDSSG